MDRINSYTGFDNDDDLAMFGMDGDVDADSFNKETTGRWTREEHLTFIKGLEMHGKGWKKIASLIKTRTVVQIRTHAQKYFLKLSKARQNGDPTIALHGRRFGSSMLKSKSKRRRPNRPVSVAPPLLPFVQSAAVETGAPQPDLDSTLYHFLSPTLGRVAACVKEEGGDGREMVTEGTEESDEDVDELPLAPAFGRTTLNQEDRTLPHWYSRCEHVNSLLQLAEGLDWGMTHSSASSADERPSRPSRSDSGDSSVSAFDLPNKSDNGSGGSSIDEWEKAPFVPVEDFFDQPLAF